MTFLDYISERRNYKTNLETINEAFKNTDMDAALKKINSLLSKKIPGLLPLNDYYNVIVGGDKCMQKQYLVFDDSTRSTMMFTINWLVSEKSTYAYSIDFYDNLDLWHKGEAKTKLSIYTLGSSIVYFLPIIINVCNNKQFHLTQSGATKLANEIFKESYDYYIGALKYTVMEGLSKNVIKDTFKMVNERDYDDDVAAFKKQKRAEAVARQAKKGETGETTTEIWAEYNEIMNAIKGGASTMSELKIALKDSVLVKWDESDPVEVEQKKMEEEHETPDFAFKKMQKYIKMVASGIQNSLIVCGAPGVGKTYNVKKTLKALGYNEGHNMITFKAKATPSVLYMTLEEYKRKGQIVLIDDADCIVGPKAPEDCINILKAALDSTEDDEGRLVTYGIRGKLMDDDGLEVPKRFYYNGGVIVLTNYQAGALNTALRGRAYVQDMNFTTADILQRIQDLMPTIKPTKLSSKSKIKAFDYLNELLAEKAPMVLSIRNYTLCADIFESAANDSDGDWDDEMAKKMIKEQMRLQAAKGKGSY